MIRYVVRRLLLMIPTLFGVTVVAFLIMQLAPGDPLLSRGDTQGGERETSRESYLAQKRSLGLDKPVLLNFHAFRDYEPSLRAAAFFLGRSAEEIERELPRLGSGAAPEAESLRRFVHGLRIPDFDARLADPAQHPGLSRSIEDFTRVWCENLGEYGVPAAMAVLRDADVDLTTRRGTVRALNFMVGDALVYSYDREPDDSETPAVTTSWRLWWERHRDDFSSPTEQRRNELRNTLKALVAADSRNELMEGLEQLRKTDAPFFAEKLLGESTLAEKNIASLMLRLYIGRPLETNVAYDASAAEVDRVTANWLAYDDYSGAREAIAGHRWWNLVADTQYAKFAVRLLTFDFGPSALGTHEPVGDRIWRAAKVSAPLMLISELLTYLIAVPLGIVCALYRGRLWDRATSFVLFVLYSVPTFVAAMLLLLLFCYGTYLKWFPMSGLHSEFAEEMPWGPWLVDYAWHACLPIACLSLFSLAGLAMYARSSMLDVISEDYIRTARAKGTPERRVIWREALRNALIPVITLFADFFPALLGGSVLIEVLFSIPGMGRLSWASIEQKDYPTLMALVYVNAIVVLVSILLADVLYCVVDPRIRTETSEEVL